MGPRRAAVNTILDVLAGGRSLAEALPSRLGELPEADRPLAQALAYGVLRHRRRLECLAEGLLAKSLRQRDRDVHTALLVGLYQLVAETVAEHAAVSETAGIARELNKPWAVRLLNGTLRRFQRERDEHLTTVDRSPACRWSLPDWLHEAWRADWPDQWRELAHRSSLQAPMTLRVNRRHGSMPEYRERLAAAGLSGEPIPGCSDALTLNRAVPVSELPGFDAGAVTVQDGAAQLAAPLLDPQPGERVLDACAAPGGKTDHLSALCAEAEVCALDVDDQRLARVRENLDRLGGQAQLFVGDATAPETWWDKRAFDRILIDAPCSGTGVVRRHPDIKWLRRPADLEALAATQHRLLSALWPLLVPGGRLIYSTCSVMRAENEAVAADFTSQQADARPEPTNLAVGWPQEYGHQILVGEAGMDGFYYVCWHKG